jgi:prevent-host-death family protein
MKEAGMGDIRVSVHELKARLSEYLGRSMHGGERIIITRRDRPVAEIVPFGAHTEQPKRGLARVDWSGFIEMAAEVDVAYNARSREDYRELSL